MCGTYWNFPRSLRNFMRCIASRQDSPAVACIGISPRRPWVRIDRIDAVRLKGEGGGPEHLISLSSGHTSRKMPKSKYCEWIDVISMYKQILGVFHHFYFLGHVYRHVFLHWSTTLASCQQLSLKKSGPQIRSPLDRGKALGPGFGYVWILGSWALCP